MQHLKSLQCDKFKNVELIIIQTKTEWSTLKYVFQIRALAYKFVVCWYTGTSVINFVSNGTI